MRAHSRLPEEHERNRHITIRSQPAQESDCEQSHYKVTKTGRRKDASSRWCRVAVLRWNRYRQLLIIWWWRFYVFLIVKEVIISSIGVSWRFCRCCRLRRRTPCSVCIQYDQGSGHHWMTVAFFRWLRCLYHTPSPCLKGSRSLVPWS